VIRFGFLTSSLCRRIFTGAVPLALGLALSTAAADPLIEIATPFPAPGLNRLAEAAGGSTLVLLGESTHGTHEFYRARAALSKALIEDHGFRFIAVEGDWAALQAVDRYVRHRPGAPGSAREALRRIERWPLWMWANADVVELAEWLREHNRNLPPERRVGFHGIDVYGLWDSYRAVLDAVDEDLPGLRTEVRQHYALLTEFVDDEQGYAEYAGSYLGDAREGVAAVAAILREHYREGDGDRFSRFELWQHAKVVQAAERHFRYSTRVGPRSWNARASHFAETANRLLEIYGEGARGVVWAHNTHIGDAEATAMRNAGQVNIGHLARREHGAEQVFLTGFTTGRGELLAAREWGGTMETTSHREPLSGTLEGELTRKFDQPTLLLWRDSSPLPSLLDNPIGHRAIGVIYQREHEYRLNYPISTPAQRYDALVFFPETTALIPLQQP